MKAEQFNKKVLKPSVFQKSSEAFVSVMKGTKLITFSGYAVEKLHILEGLYLGFARANNDWYFYVTNDEERGYKVTKYSTFRINNTELINALCNTYSIFTTEAYRLYILEEPIDLDVVNPTSMVTRTVKAYRLMDINHLRNKVDNGKKKS